MDLMGLLSSNIWQHSLRSEAVNEVLFMSTCLKSFPCLLETVFFFCMALH